MATDIMKEAVHRLRNGEDFERVRWVDDETIYASLNDVPLIINIKVDERYEILLELEKQAHEACDKLRHMGYHFTANAADQLAYDIANLELEL